MAVNDDPFVSMRLWYWFAFGLHLLKSVSHVFVVVRGTHWKFFKI